MQLTYRSVFHVFLAPANSARAVSSLGSASRDHSLIYRGAPYTQALTANPTEPRQGQGIYRGTPFSFVQPTTVTPNAAIPLTYRGVTYLGSR